MNKQSEIKSLVKETQDSIKIRLFSHGSLKELSDKTGISLYLIRQTINEPNPDLALLERIEKALLRISADKVQNPKHVSKQKAA